MGYFWLRKLLFLLPTEVAHHLVLCALCYMPRQLLPKIPIYNSPIEVMGLRFAHPIGLAAGLDKNAEYMDGLSKLGFSFIEVGTITPKPQPGNLKPRLFRIPQAQALINRMGFNNKGVHALVNNIRKSQYRGILGINIGKNKDTPLAHAVDDYEYCMESVYPLASYITVNISSPNTPELRALQQGDFFEHLIDRLTKKRQLLTNLHHKQVPLVVKISPDESEETLEHIVKILLQYQVEAIIATNTTTQRDEDIIGLQHVDEAGGLSGAPLREKALQCLRFLKSVAGDRLTLIASGGIDSPQAIQERLQAGASLVQVYSGLIYQGPAILRYQ